MRPALQINLTEEDRATLTMWARAGTTQQRFAKRAQVILQTADGVPLDKIAQNVGLGRQSCIKWRKRFGQDNIEGLRDKARSGKPPAISAQDKASIVALACTTPPDGSNQWSVRKLAEVTGYGKTTINRILSQAAIKPHKHEYWCGKSPDPEFEEKQAAIIGLYMNPPENALVLCVDEKSQIQALDRTQPMLPMRSGNAKRLTATYKRNGTTCLLAALAVHEGTIDGRCVDRNTHKEFLAYLKSLYRKYPGKELHVIMDNLKVHKHKAVLDWAKKRRRLTLHFTPTYSSWLNQVEIWFNILARDVLRGGIWQSKQQLIQQLMEYIRNYNKLWAKPFKWTYTGQPLAK